MIKFMIFASNPGLPPDSILLSSKSIHFSMMIIILKPPVCQVRPWGLKTSVHRTLTALGDGYYHSHLTDEEARAQTVPLTCLKSKK